MAQPLTIETTGIARELRRARRAVAAYHEIRSLGFRAEAHVLLGTVRWWPK